LAVPRQNGKNAVLEIRELYGMIALGERFLHTAHEVKTARKAFTRLVSFFENRHYPELADLVKEIRRTNGQEAIVLSNGGSCEFVARSKGSGRGFTVDVLVLDEAQELSEDSLAALQPTISAAPSGNPQTIHTGTPPSPIMQGDVWTRVRDAGVKGADKRLCWHEWSVKGTVDLDDRRTWADTNPSLGYRMNIETLMDERESFDDQTFARERLGMWASLASQQVIPAEAWMACADTRSQVLDPVAFAVDVTPDRSSASIALAGRREDGLLHVEVVDNHSGTAWVVDRLVELRDKWSPSAIAVDPGSPAGSLLVGLEAAGVEPLLVSTRELVQACGAFYDAAVDLRLRHRDEPILNRALGAARKRSLGDAWAWHRKDATDISPLVAVTIALSAHERTWTDQPADSRVFVFR
jgi:phage terminase large subunit-like protein